MKNIVFSIFLLFSSLQLFTVVAQEGAVDVNVTEVNPNDVNNVSDTQLEEAVKQAESKGYSQTQIEQAARLKGMSEADINQLRNRIYEMQNNPDSESSEIDMNVLREEFPELELEDVEELEDGLDKNAGELGETSMRRFGADIFNGKNLKFNPNLNIPTPKDYELGTGDKLLISVWGASEATYQMTISAEGNIRIPNLGPIYLSGLTVNEASRKVISRLSRIYSGLSGDNINTYAEVTLSSTRTIKVMVIGEARNPGVYTISSFATIFHALYYAGGTASSGSLRAISLYRNNKKIVDLDVYDFLIDADKSKNIRLEDDDVIMVMPYQKRVIISGAVRRANLSFDLKEGETLGDLIEYAGGFTDQAYPDLINIKRVTKEGLEKITINGGEFESVLLQSSDAIDVASILGAYKNRVTIKGALVRPGQYELAEGMTLTELIEQASGLSGNAFLLRGQIVRVLPNLEKTVIPFNLANILEGKDQDILLNSEDVVNIRTESSLHQYRYISVLGEVNKPKRVAFSPDLRIEDAIFSAGGFTNAAVVTEVDISRRVDVDSLKDITKSSILINVPIQSSLEYLGDSNRFKLKPYDQIIVRRSPYFEVQKYVIVKGESNNPGIHSILRKDEKLSEILERSQGVTEFAYPEAATLTRRGKKIAIELDKIMKGIDKYDIVVKPGDVISIPRVNNFVEINGAVLRPNTVIKYQKENTYKRYVSISGGFNSDALKRKSYIVYPNGMGDRTRSFLFVKKYPKVLPGSKIFVPEKREKQRLTAAQWIALGTSIASMALIVDRIVANGNGN